MIDTRHTPVGGIDIHAAAAATTTPLHHHIQQQHSVPMSVVHGVVGGGGGGGGGGGIGLMWPTPEYFINVGESYDETFLNERNALSNNQCRQQNWWKCI